MMIDCKLKILTVDRVDFHLILRNLRLGGAQAIPSARLLLYEAQGVLNQGTSQIMRRCAFLNITVVLQPRLECEYNI